MTRMSVVAFFVVAICMQCFTAAAEEPIKIGVFLPMTGNVSAFGQMEWLGIKTAQQMMGKILGREVKLILEDSKSEQTEAARAVERLIKQHQVVGIIGGAISGTALAGGQ